MNEYLKSSFISFVAGFALAVIPMIDSLTLESVKSGALIGVFFVGIRLGLKMALEAFIMLYNKRRDTKLFVFKK